MAEQLINTNWLGQDEFNTFIDEVSTVHQGSAADNPDGEVADIEAHGDDDDMANLRSVQDHIDLQACQKSFTKTQRLALDHIVNKQWR